MHARWVRCRRSPVCAPLVAGEAAVTVQPPVPAQPALTDPFDRMLMTTDGTVTTLLEACTGEPIVTRARRQSGPATLDELRSTAGCWWHTDTRILELAATERLIARRVSLSGERSGTTYVAAESLVVPGRLPELLAKRLSRPGASLGRVIDSCQLETRREVHDVAIVRAGAVDDPFAVGSTASLAQRTYTIAVGRRPVAAVTEWLVPGRLAETAG
jgi:chorismate-pyruvate lyase